MFFSVATLGKKFDMGNVILRNLAVILFFALFFIETWGCKTSETYTWPNGDTYTGEWKDGLPHGLGKLYVAKGKILEGRFEKGEYIKKE